MAKGSINQASVVGTGIEVRSMNTPSRRGILVMKQWNYYRNARPNRYPIPKKTRITTATISATSPIMGRKLGWSSSIVHRIEARCAGGPAQQIGDQIERSGGDHDAVRPASSRARASARAGSRTISAGGPPSWVASDCSVGGGKARGF